MEIIRLNSKGDQVKKWQLFLIGQGLLKSIADGIFGQITETASKEFQKKQGLVADGIIGQLTYARAMVLGLRIVEEPTIIPEKNKDYYWTPPLPNFNPLCSNQDRQKIFGKYSYLISEDGNSIKITDDWAKNNIIAVKISQLAGITGAPKSGNIFFHKLVAKQFQELFKAWEKEGLTNLVISWAGSYVPRLVRGSKNVLSNHDFGTAFDINVTWNGLGVIPARVGQKGSVRKLVPVANQFGFYWGGHYPERPDGMHFEVAKILA